MSARKRVPRITTKRFLAFLRRQHACSSGVARARRAISRRGLTATVGALAARTRAWMLSREPGTVTWFSRDPGLRDFKWLLEEIEDLGPTRPRRSYETFANHRASFWSRHEDEAWLRRVRLERRRRALAYLADPGGILWDLAWAIEDQEAEAATERMSEPRGGSR